MTLEWKELGDGQLPSSKTTLYTVPADKTALIMRITLINTAGSTKVVNLYKKASGGTSRRIIEKDWTLAIAGAASGASRYTFIGPLTLEEGAEIEGDAATAAVVDFTISGVERDAAAGGGGGGGGIGLITVVPMQGGNVDTSGPTSYAGGADEARMFAVQLAAPMWVQALQVKAVGAASGTHEWGLFDASADATAAVKMAGGSGAIAGGDWNDIPATGAPVLVPAGAYILVFKWPNANRATIYYHENGPSAKCSKQITTWTWDDTPDLVTTWATSPSVFNMQLVGDMDASGSGW